MALVLLISLLLGLNRWLLEPLLSASSDVLELNLLPWLAIGLLAWLLAGEQKRN